MARTHRNWDSHTLLKDLKGYRHFKENCHILRKLSINGAYSSVVPLLRMKVPERNKNIFPYKDMYVCFIGAFFIIAKCSQLETG